MRAPANYSTNLLRELLHSPRRFVAALGDNLIFDWLALLVLHGKRFVRCGIHQFHLDLAERPIVLRVARLVRQYVLVAQGLMQHLENLPIFALKSREIRGAASLLRERAQFIIRL